MLIKQYTEEARRRMALRASVVGASARWLFAAALVNLFCTRAFGFDVPPPPSLTTSEPSELWYFLP
ncbi:MAG TPA: hypothetical protein VEX60_10845, partial [Pyrinomonadaceae bacterium]|nr:hypothetical protein [Pyrinomonadaceae bacterium]